MTLEWQPHETDANCLVSTCKRYCVSTHSQRWQAWRMNVEGSLFREIGRNLPSSDEAKQVAQADADRVGTAA